MYTSARSTRWIAFWVALAGSAGVVASAYAAQVRHVVRPGDAALIASAMRAAPDSVSRDATVLVPENDGSLRVVRPGHNDYTCMPDNPASPGRDSMCMDRNGLAWLKACMAGRTPPRGRLGLMYMLEGGSDASNTDPTLTRPPRGQAWIQTGPHVMLVGADPAFYANYPTGPRPDTSLPYVMWAGTPCQHLMAPTI